MNEIVGPVSEAPRFERLVDYHKVVLDLAGELKRLAVVARELELTEGTAQIDGVIRRLEEDRFTLAIVGEFKRGKSTFLNALLGVDVLPTDVLPPPAAPGKLGAQTLASPSASEVSSCEELRMPVAGWRSR